MPRDLTPIEQRPTQHLQLRFDRLCSNSIVADAIEAFAIMTELSRRQAIAEQMRRTPANEATNAQQPARPDEQTDKGGPNGAAG